MIFRRRYRVAVIASTLSLVSVPAVAQSLSGCGLDATVGAGVPVSDPLNQNLRTGTDLGLGVICKLGGRIHASAEASLQDLQRAVLIYIMPGVGLTVPVGSSWLLLRVRAGYASSKQSGSLTITIPGAKLDGSGFALDGGARFLVPVSRTWSFFLDGSVRTTSLPKFDRRGEVVGRTAFTSVLLGVGVEFRP